MTEFDLNLSTRPFPAYRRINIALVFVFVILSLLSAWQALGFVRYSKLARSIRTGEMDTRVQAEALGKRVAELESRLDRPESTAKLNEIGFLNRLILRKNFSWTRLFANLEEIVPDNVHFLNITPDVSGNESVHLSLAIRARSNEDVKEFLQRVEMSPLFEKVIVNSVQKKDATLNSELEVTLSAVYYPERDNQ